MTQKPTPLERYQTLVQAGELTPDAAQARVARALEELFQTLDRGAYSRKSSALGWLLMGRRRPEGRGLYIHGAVGRGKTMLMDIFFQAVDCCPKRRVHFHAFMNEVHDRIQAYRAEAKAGRAKDTDPIPPVAKEVAKEARLLCFDEFQVTDIADAMILGRLFEALFAQGVVVVATSNQPPERLYHNGLNRQLFIPFIRMLEDRLDILHLDSDRDYRHRALTRSDIYFSPLDAEAEAGMERLWRSLTLGAAGEPQEIRLKGRSLKVPRAASGVARFPAQALIDKPLGARDFLAIVERFHTIMIDGLPDLAARGANAQRRFVLLVDTAYDMQRALAISAEVPPEALQVDGELGFEFQRTVSRLREMRSEDYLARVRLERRQEVAEQ